MFENIDLIIWRIVEIGISIGIGLWILSMFLPIDEIFNWLKNLLSGRVVVKCKKCGNRNLESSKYCSECGEKL